MRWLDEITDNGHEFQQTPGDSEAWCAVVHGASKSQVLLSN